MICVLQLCAIHNLYAITYISNQSGGYNTSSIWTPFGVPDLTIWDGSAEAVISDGDSVVKVGNLQVEDGNTLRVDSGGVLTIMSD